MKQFLISWSKRLCRKSKISFLHFKSAKNATVVEAVSKNDAPTKKKSFLEIRNLSKEFEGNIVLKSLSFSIKSGEFVTILGPSGCGKTTLLRIIAGFEKLNAGTISFEDSDMRDLPAYMRPLNTIFQNYALFPHMNVHDNVAYALSIRKVPANQIKTSVNEILELVNLSEYSDKQITELSGGQQQRVAIARALINKPKLLLLDEPLSALDKNFRKTMQVELKRIQRRVGITFILVTHDQEEALTMSDRLIVMNDGLIKQIGTPLEVYNEPESLWVAKFIGDSNLITDGIFLQNYLVFFDDKKLKCTDVGFGKNSSVDIVIRPEDILLYKHFRKDAYFVGEVISIAFKGVHWAIVVKTEKRNYLVHTTTYLPKGEIVSLKWEPEAIHVMWKEN